MSYLKKIVAKSLENVWAKKPFKEIEKFVKQNHRGNYESDGRLINILNAFILKNYKANKEEAKKALSLLYSLMGDNSKVSDKDLKLHVKEFLEQENYK